MNEKERRGREHVTAWKASGLTQQQYCEQHGLSRPTLGYWSWKINRETTGGEFVEVHQGVRAPASVNTKALELVVKGGYRIRLGEGFSVDALRRLLVVLEQR